MATAKIPKSALRFSDDLHVQFSEDEDKKASMLAYSGKPMSHPIFGDLVVDVSGIKFQNSKIPILEDHEEDRKLGFSGKPSTEGNVVRFDDITLLDNEIAQAFYRNASKGFPYQASISFYPKKVEEISQDSSAEVNGFTQKGPALIFRESVFRESSVVTFGMDPHTSSVAQDDETVSVILSEDSAKIFNSYLRGEPPHEDFTSVENPRTPSYNGTETSPSWGSVSKTFNAYKKALGYGDADWNDWSNAPSDFRKKAASTSFAGDAGADTFDKGVYYPAVNPKSGKLNKGGVLAAQRYAAQNNHTAVEQKADALYKKEFENNEKKEHNMTEEMEKLQNKLKEYEEKLSEYDQRMYELQKEKVKTDLSHKLGEENATWLMKFYDNLSQDQLSEISNKILEFHDTINKLGEAKGAGGGFEETPREPTVDEVRKYAADSGLSFGEANKQLTMQRQVH